MHYLFIFTDFAVGAPYDGLGRGAVFIYHGSAEGVRREHSQVRNEF